MNDASKHNFETEYYRSNYSGNYLNKSPNIKFAFYLSEILKFKKSGNLLDIGCAYGNFISLASKYFHCIGTDVSSYAIRMAIQSNISKSKFIHISFHNFSHPNKFDVITCFDTLEHLKNLNTNLKHLKQHLLPNGIICLAVPVYDGPFGWLVHLLDHDKTHLHKHSRHFWRNQINQTGFHIQKQYGIFRYLFGKKYIHFAHPLFTYFSPAIMLILSHDNYRPTSI